MDIEQDIEQEDAWSSLGVPSVIRKALVQQGFYTPTEIQTLAIPPAILGRRDILGAAETGSGKTLAFGIPVLDGILKLKQKQASKVLTPSGAFTVLNADQIDIEDDECSNTYKNEQIIEENVGNRNGKDIGLVKVINNIHLDGFDNIPKPKHPLYALILTPTRELAVQIKNHLSKAAKFTGIKIAVVVGGMAAVKQERMLKRGPEIVIATPGRLWELINEQNEHLSQIATVRYFVIDETDRMLEKGHFQELEQILERMNANKCMVEKRRNFVFSATLTFVHDIPDYLARKKSRNSKSKIFKITPGQKVQKMIRTFQMKDPKIIDITKSTGTAGKLTECRIACTIDHKDYYLYYFLKRHPGRTLVFCNSIGCVKRLATLFNILKCKPLPLHASMPQPLRLKNLEKFHNNENGLLIATDVAARGLDIPQIEHIVHYQVPRTAESYIHRSGRTARAEKEGLTLLMMEPSEKQYYSKLCHTLNRTDDLPTFPVEDRLLVAVKERVNVAREIDKLDLSCRKYNSQKGWLQKAAKEMDLLIDEDDEYGSSTEAKEKSDVKRLLKAKRNLLDTLVKKPLFPKNFSGKYLDCSLKFSLDQDSQKAIDVMKEAIENDPKSKKRPRLHL